ncbi:hypothetical protein [Agrobacterium cavarae]|uniref:hypothetical protein n=1 Tax=Agrobacterium cavarae TaxID=2528239 RepID=UPI00289E2109|nr:hypothetical protein [Agrobacterium cavarae]
MTAVQKQKGPATAPTVPSHGQILSPSQDIEMNKPTNITASATAPDLNELCDAMEAIWSDICDLQRKAYLLMGELDSSLDPKRGKTSESGTVTLMFQERGIDVTQWLGSEVWSNTVDLEKKADALFRRIEGAVA